MDIKEQLKDIKTQLRLSMNGAVSQSMREKGLVYKLNFGVELPRIKMIAEGYEKNHDLAQALWKEEIRECKILAGMLQPIETFYPEIADIWVENIRNIEIAELTCMNLFQHLPYAPAKSFHWIADSADSLLALIGRWIAPVFAPLGFADWRCATSLISGFIAKESVVSTLQILLGGAALSTMFTGRSVISFLVFTLLYTPCIAAVATIRREFGSTLKTVGVVMMQCCVAWIVALAVYTLVGIL